VVLRSGGWIRFAAFAAALFVGANGTLAEPARAQEAPSAPAFEKGTSETGGPWLKWSAPPECPTRGELVEQIQAALGRPIAEGSELSVVIVVEPTEGGFLAHVGITEGGETSGRSVSFANCEEAAKFSALAVALALGSPEAPSTPAPEPTREAASAPGTTPGVQGATSPRPVAPVGAEIPRPDHEASEQVWFVGAMAEISSGLLPKEAFGVVLMAGRTFERVRVDARVNFIPSSVYELGSGENPVAMNWVGGALGACRETRLGPLRIGPCLRMQVGGLHGEEESPPASRPPHGGTGFYFGLTANLEAYLEIGARIHLFGAIGGAVPLVADRFILSDGGVVHSPNAGGAAALGLLYFF
jgi:hypothetical protein